MSSVDDYCTILGVPKGTTDKSSLEKAYRQKSLSAHPDKGGSVEEQQILSSAYKALLKHAHQQQWGTSNAVYGSNLVAEPLKLKDVNAFKL